MFRLSQDDKARIPNGITTVNKQAPLLMRWEADYRCRLPDHDFVVAPSHKLISSVYAGLRFESEEDLSYSGPTFIAIRSAKHDSSTAQTHCTDFEELIELEEFSSLAKHQDGRVKPIVIITVDGSPDENPRFPNVIAANAYLFKKYDLDVLFVATNAPGRSAFNEVERRMAPLSEDLAGHIFAHDHYGNYLYDSEVQHELKSFLLPTIKMLCCAWF